MTGVAGDARAGTDVRGGSDPMRHGPLTAHGRQCRDGAGGREGRWVRGSRGRPARPEDGRV